MIERYDLEPKIPNFDKYKDDKNFEKKVEEILAANVKTKNDLPPMEYIVEKENVPSDVVKEKLKKSLHI